jgi:hypothetical protein
MDMIAERIFNLHQELGQSAGVDSIMDRYKSGAIGAYTDLLNISFEDAQND